MIRLTKTEYLIFKRLRDAQSREDICASLIISKRTLEGHLHRVCQKFNVDNSLQALALFIQYDSEGKIEVRRKGKTPAETIDAIKKMRASGLTLRAIADAFNLSIGAVQRMGKAPSADDI